MLRRILSLGVLSWSCSFFTASEMTAQTSTADCAKVIPESGTACPKLKVKFDLSACKDSAVSVPSVICDGTKVTASVRSASYEYKVVFEETEQWGKKAYEMVGYVNKASIDGSSVDSEKSEEPKKFEEPKKSEPKKSEPKKAATSATSTSTSPRPASFENSLTFSGLADVYYSYNFNRPRSVTPQSSPTGSATTVTVPTGNNGYRAYDAYHNQFSLNQVELSLKKVAGPVTLVMDLDFGELADINHSTFTTATTSTTEEVSKHIGQAVISYAPSEWNGWGLSAGKMATHLGLELIKAKDNWQYSRSFTYWYGLPIWHTGLTFGGPVTESLSTNFYLYNGWNSLNDNNDGKTYGLQFKWAPNANFAALYNIIAGPEFTGDNGSWRSVNEINFVWQALPEVAFAGEGLFGYEPIEGTTSNRWIGFTYHSKWDINENIFVSPRIEFFRDFTGSRLLTTADRVQNLWSWTITTGYTLAKGLMIKPELRVDLCVNDDIFTGSENEAKPSQTTASVAALYNF